MQYERRKPEKVWCKKPKEQTNVNITTNQFVALAEEEPYQKEEEVESAQNNKKINTTEGKGKTEETTKGWVNDTFF